MLAVCAFLPFLPLIDDAMIRQLGDDDFRKREAATRFLVAEIKLGTWGGITKIQQATKSNNPEIARRSQSIWDKDRMIYLKPRGDVREHPYFFVTGGDSKDQRQLDNNDMMWKRIQQEMGEFLPYAQDWVVLLDGTCRYRVWFRTCDVPPRKLFKICQIEKLNPEKISICPVNDELCKAIQANERQEAKLIKKIKR